MELQLTEALGSWVAADAWRPPLTSLVAAFVYGQVLAWTYERTHAGMSYSRSFNHAVVLVCIAATALVLAMRTSLLAGLGLFGILSMIRFRTDLKTPRDLVFVMGAACVGVAAGVHSLTVAFLATAIFSSVALYLQFGRFGARAQFDGILRFHLRAKGEGSVAAQGLLEERCRRFALVSLKDLFGDEVVEHTYQVAFFRNDDRPALVNALRDQAGAEQVQLLLQDAAEEF